MDCGDRSGVAEEESTVADRDAIVRVALDYFEGWFDGDAARMAVSYTHLTLPTNSRV